ncbi:hypothetical protein BJV78DRAFT_624120 [Lactifluus subvellereus]|nr:hypothetical protein BJV78DRAFT_624120 [Lactifluus subvellereus]
MTHLSGTQLSHHPGHERNVTARRAGAEAFYGLGEVCLYPFTRCLIAVIGGNSDGWSACSNSPVYGGHIACFEIRNIDPLSFTPRLPGRRRRQRSNSGEMNAASALFVACKLPFRRKKGKECALLNVQVGRRFNIRSQRNGFLRGSDWWLACHGIGRAELWMPSGEDEGDEKDKKIKRVGAAPDQFVC